MNTGSLAVVAAWSEAVNEGAARRVEELSAEQIEVLGPRGSGHMPSSDLSAWMIRSGFSGRPLRWFCGGDGRVVVELAARWRDRETGAEQSTAVVASDFRVEKDRIARVGRHNDLETALAESGLTMTDEVTSSK